MREAAARHLLTLLACPALRACIPAASQMEAALTLPPAAASSEAEPDPRVAEAAPGVPGLGPGSSSLDTLSRLAPLLCVPEFMPQLLEGFAASIGGVDASLSKQASAALMDALEAETTRQQQPGAGPDAGAQPPSSTMPAATHQCSAGGVGIHARVSACLLEIWSRHAKSARMSVPLLRTALLLVCKWAGMINCRPAAGHLLGADGQRGEGGGGADVCRPARGACAGRDAAVCGRGAAAGCRLAAVSLGGPA